MNFLSQFIIFLIIVIALLYLFGGWKLFFGLSKIFSKKVKKIKDEMGKNK